MLKDGVDGKVAHLAVLLIAVMAKVNEVLNVVVGADVLYILR